MLGFAKQAPRMRHKSLFVRYAVLKWRPAVEMFPPWIPAGTERPYHFCPILVAAVETVMPRVSPAPLGLVNAHSFVAYCKLEKW